jgi:hypothetical protein
MALLAVAVLVATVGVRGLGCHAVVTQQGLIARRVLLGVTVVVHGQRHTIGAMTLGYAAHGPKRMLRPLAQAGEALREAQRHVFPIRVGQHEVVQQVWKGLSLNGHAQAVHVREIRRAQPARFMHLAEKHFLGRPVLGFPAPHPPFHGPPLPLPVLAGVFPLQPLHQRFGLQPWLTLQQRFQTRPDVDERIDPGAPGVRCPGLGRELVSITVLPCGLAIHACFHRCELQRRPPVKVLAECPDLSIVDLTSCPHVATPFAKKLPA